MNRSLTILMLAGLSGCATGPRYEGPAVELALAKPFANESNATATSASLQTWWTQLGDPTLDALISDTLARNLDVEVARARLRQARAQRQVVNADGLPTLNAAGVAQRQTFSENIDFGFGQGAQQGGGGQGGGQPGGGQAGGLDPSQLGAGGAAINFFQGSFDAAWEIDLFGANRSRSRAADAQVTAAALEIDDTRVSIAAEVARDYLVVREIQARLVTSRDSLAIARRTQELAREQQRAGLVTEADTARTDAQVLAVEAAIPQLELLELQASQRLAVMAAREPSALRSTLAPVGSIPIVAQPIAAGLPSELLLRRPDIRMAERQLAAAANSEASAVRNLYPKLSLNASAGTQADTVGGLFDWASKFYRLSANLTAPILDGGRRKARVELERGRVDEAAARYRQTIFIAFREVEDGLAAIARNRQRLTLAESTVERRDRARSVLDEQFRAGLVGLLDLLTAERELAEARSIAANARAQVTVDWIGLQKALGGGWNPTPATTKEGGV